jgi:hypothetical protein
LPSFSDRWNEYSPTDAKKLALLIRSQEIDPARLQATCAYLAEQLQRQFAGILTGYIHVLPVQGSLELLAYPPNTITPAIVTVVPLPAIARPTLVIECYSFNLWTSLGWPAEPLNWRLTDRLRTILTECQFAIRETQLVLVPAERRPFRRRRRVGSLFVNQAALLEQQEGE